MGSQHELAGEAALNVRRLALKILGDRNLAGSGEYPASPTFCYTYCRPQYLWLLLMVLASPR
jgi:hypothetical protein